MLSIQPNSDALRASRLYGEHSRGLATAVERLSSAKRVNSARDDAAGLAIAERMTTAIRSNAHLQRALNDGISLVQVADHALGTVQSLLQRARELAVQSANGTLGAGERSALDGEFQKISAEIDRIAGGTKVFGIQPLTGNAANVTVPPSIVASVPNIRTLFPTSGSSGTFTSGVKAIGYIPGGASNVTITINSLGADDDLQVFTRNGVHVAGTPISGSAPDYVWSHNAQGVVVTNTANANSGVLTTTNGFMPTASYDASALQQGPASYAFPASTSSTYNGMTVSYTGDGDRSEPGALFNNGTNDDVTKYQERLNIDVVTEDLVVLAVGSGAFSATVSWGQMPTQSGGSAPSAAAGAVRVSSTIPIVSDAAAGSVPEFIDIQRTPADTQTLGIAGTGITTQSGSLAAIGAVDGALDLVGDYRADYGAYVSRFDSAIGNLGIYNENMSASRGRITDADYAQASAERLRSDVLADASLAMVTQANSFQEVALNLLRQSTNRGA